MKKLSFFFAHKFEMMIFRLHHWFHLLLTIKMNGKQRKYPLFFLSTYFNFEIISRKLETLMHIIKGNIGAGILAFPYALSKAGILV